MRSVSASQRAFHSAMLVGVCCIDAHSPASARFQLLERCARIGHQRQAGVLEASNSATLILMKRTSGFWNAVFDAVVKSLSRVPMAITRSASRAAMFAPGVPVTPIAPRFCG